MYPEVIASKTGKHFLIVAGELFEKYGFLDPVVPSELNPSGATYDSVFLYHSGKN